MEYISSDTNIWIDFASIRKLDYPFRLPYGFLMNVDAVCDELLSPPGIKEDLLALGLIATDLSETEFYYALSIASMYPKLSAYDRAALAIAKKRNITLMTGDRALREAAKREGVKVIGTLGILDQLYGQALISNDEYIECLNLLNQHNGLEIRLPSDEIKKRLDKTHNP